MNHAQGALEILPSDTPSDLLLCAEHAGMFVPERLNGMELPRRELERHIGWDIGIGDTVRELHAITGLPAILGHISRLVVDLNRPVTSDECIPEASDGTSIPANRRLSAEERIGRITDYHLAFHRGLNSLIAAHRPKILLCLHSFTPRLRSGGAARPWHCGVLFDSQAELGRACIAHLERRGDIAVGENQPYRVDHDRDQPVPLHGELKGIPTLLIEIRNDQINRADGRTRWANIIAEMISGCLIRRLDRTQALRQAA